MGAAADSDRAFADGGKYTLGVFPSVGGRLANAILMTPDSGITLVLNPSGLLKRTHREGAAA